MAGSNEAPIEPRCVLLQYDSLIEESEAGNGCHMDFATYGNLKSIVWKQNPPLPEDRAGVLSCNVAFGEDWGNPKP